MRNSPKVQKFLSSFFQAGIFRKMLNSSFSVGKYLIIVDDNNPAHGHCVVSFIVDLEQVIDYGDVLMHLYLHQIVFYIRFFLKNVLSH